MFQVLLLRLNVRCAVWLKTTKRKPGYDLLETSEFSKCITDKECCFRSRYHLLLYPTCVVLSFYLLFGRCRPASSKVFQIYTCFESEMRSRAFYNCICFKNLWCSFLLSIVILAPGVYSFQTHSSKRQ